MYGPVAADHLKAPRNLGRIVDADGIGDVDDPASETLLTIYLKARTLEDGRQVVSEARFRAFGCGGCIITGSITTELAAGRLLDQLDRLDGAAIEQALANGLPEEQRYCADLAARALQLAAHRALHARRDEG